MNHSEEKAHQKEDIIMVIFKNGHEHSIGRYILGSQLGTHNTLIAGKYRESLDLNPHKRIHYVHLDINEL